MKPFGWTLALLALVLFGAAPVQVQGDLDSDMDGDVDMADARAFFDCFGDVECSANSTPYDANTDGIVDLDDYALLEACLGGPDEPASADCLAAFDAEPDGDVDMADVRAFFDCYGDAECTIHPLTFDFNFDGLVDLEDYALFFACFGGPDEPLPDTCGLMVVAGGPASLEDGQSGQMTATVSLALGEVTYFWSVVAGDAIFDDPTAQNPIIWINGENDVTARVDVMDLGGRFAFDEWTITVIPEGDFTYRVYAGDDHTTPFAPTAPTEVELSGAYYDPAGCPEAQNEWEWSLVLAPPGASGWFLNPHELDTIFTLDQEIKGKYLFELSGASDPVACGGDFDTDTVAIFVGTPDVLQVTLTCPALMEWDETVELIAAVIGATGTLTYEWTATEGIIDGTGFLVEFTSNSEFDSEVTVTVTDDRGTPGVPFDDEVVFDTCTIEKFVNPVSCDVGEDRIFVDDLAGDGFDFTDFIFSYGNNPGDDQNVIPEALYGEGFDSEGDPGDLNLEWTITGVPQGMVVQDVIITGGTGSTPLDLEFVIVPDVFASADLLHDNGLLTDLHDIVAPGPYTFTLDVWRPDFSASDSCELNVSLYDTFKTSLDDLPALNGTAPANATPIHVTTSPNSKTIYMAVLSMLPGQIQWVLQDTSLAGDAWPDQDLSTNGVFPGSDTFEVTLSMPIGGTFNLNADFITADPETTVMADPANPTAVVAHFQPDVFQILGPVTTPTLDSSDLDSDENVDFAVDLPHYGRVSSTQTPNGGETEYTFHGAHAAEDALDFDGPRIRSCDYNCDGLMDLLILDENRRYIHACSPLAFDPEFDDETGIYGTPIDNALNNDGTIDVGVEDIKDFEKFYITLDGTLQMATDIAVADLNDDGFPDLIVGEGLYDGPATPNSLEGRVRVFYHQGAGWCNLESSPWPTSQIPTFRRQDSQSPALDFLFGWRLAIADFNGDEIDDIIVSAPGDNGAGGIAGHTESGRVYVIPGKTTKYTGTAVIADDPGALGVPGAVVIGEFNGSANGDLFGASLDAYDVNTDGLADLVIGAPGFNGMGTDVGAAYLVLGTDADTWITAGEFHDRYEGDADGLGLGRQVVCCDYNGNGIVDYAVSAYNATAGNFDAFVDDVQGGIFLLLDDPDSGVVDLATVPQVAGDNPNSNLGSVLAVGDWNGDGFDDVLTTATSSGGSPNLDDQKVFLFNGEAFPGTVIEPDLTIVDGLGDDWLNVVSTAALPMNGTAQDALRCNTNWIGFFDFNGDGIDDLAFSESMYTDDVSVVYGVDDE